MKYTLRFFIILICLLSNEKVLAQKKADNFSAYLNNLCDKNLKYKKINVLEKHRGYSREESKMKITQKISIYGLNIVYNLWKNKSPYLSEFIINGESISIKGYGNLSGEILEHNIYTFSNKDFFFIHFYLYRAGCNGRYCRLSLHYIVKISKKTENDIEVFGISGGFEDTNLYPVNIRNFSFLYLEDIHVSEIHTLIKEYSLNEEIIKNISEKKNYYLVSLQKVQKNNMFDFVYDLKTKKKYFILIEVDMFFVPTTYKVIYKNWIE